MFLENWMIVVLLVVFGLGLCYTWVKAYSIGHTEGGEDLAMMLTKMNIINAEYEDGILRITKINDTEVVKDEEAP